MSAVEPDWDAGTEVAYERHLERMSGLIDGVSGLLDQLESEMRDAYDITDPKHPGHYEAMVDATDMRDGTERLP